MYIGRFSCRSGCSISFGYRSRLYHYTTMWDYRVILGNAGIKVDIMGHVLLTELPSDPFIHRTFSIEHSLQISCTCWALMFLLDSSSLLLLVPWLLFLLWHPEHWPQLSLEKLQVSKGSSCRFFDFLEDMTLALQSHFGSNNYLENSPLLQVYSMWRQWLLLRFHGV